jgi:hypothetical protein
MGNALTAVHRFDIVTNTFIRLRVQEAEGLQDFSLETETRLCLDPFRSELPLLTAVF